MRIRAVLGWAGHLEQQYKNWKNYSLNRIQKQIDYILVDWVCILVRPCDYRVRGSLIITQSSHESLYTTRTWQIGLVSIATQFISSFSQWSPNHLLSSTQKEKTGYRLEFDLLLYSYRNLHCVCFDVSASTRTNVYVHVNILLLPLPMDHKLLASNPLIPSLEDEGASVLLVLEDDCPIAVHQYSYVLAQEREIWLELARNMWSRGMQYLTIGKYLPLFVFDCLQVACHA